VGRDYDGLYYRDGARAFFEYRLREARLVFIGPADRKINGYERLGRIVAGCVWITAWLALGLLYALLAAGFVYVAIGMIHAAYVGGPAGIIRFFASR
jgi:hypothetical protein